jgi:hypothetical protein
MRTDQEETGMVEKFVNLKIGPVDLTSSAYLAIALVPALGAVPDESVTRVESRESSVASVTDQASTFDDVE